MTRHVNIDSLAEEMQFQNDQVRGHLDRETGEVIFVSDDDVRAIEDGEIDGLSVDEDAVAELEAVLNDESGRYIALPDPFDIHEWQMMDDFARQIEDADASAELRNAIRGRGAFRMFKATADRLGLVQQWYDYRDARYREIAIQWCKDHDVPCENPSS